MEPASVSSEKRKAFASSCLLPVNGNFYPMVALVKLAEESSLIPTVSDFWTLEQKSALLLRSNAATFEG